MARPLGGSGDHKKIGVKLVPPIQHFCVKYTDNQSAFLKPGHQRERGVCFTGSSVLPRILGQGVFGLRFLIVLVQ